MEASGGAGGAEGAHGRESSSHAAAARLHASLQLASVYVHPTECAVAAGIVAGSLSACRARSLARRRLLLALASSLGVLYAAKNAVCYGIALLFETTLDPAAGAGVLEELESKMAAKRFHVKPRKEKRASWSPFGRKKAAEAPPVTLSLSRENLRRLFDELDVDKSGALDAQEVRRLIERYFAATVSIFRESSPRLFHKAGLADCSEEELLPEKVVVSFIQAFSETPVTLQARAEIRRKIDETVQEVFQSIDENHDGDVSYEEFEKVVVPARCRFSALFKELVGHKPSLVYLVRGSLWLVVACALIRRQLLARRQRILEVVTGNAMSVTGLVMVARAVMFLAQKHGLDPSATLMKVLTSVQFRPVVTYFYREMYSTPAHGKKDPYRRQKRPM